MRTALTRADALPLAEKIAADLASAADEITALDQQMGDGDLGVTCRLGMKAVLDGLPSLQDETLDQILLKSGMSFNSAGASTYGALVATAAMRGAKVAKDRGLDEWDLESIAAATRAAAEGIEQRGKAQRGEKTMLDALWPGVEALESASAAGKTLAEAFADAVVAVEAGVESTKPLKAKYGRAAWLQDQTVGVQDPGSTVVLVVFRAIAAYLED